MNIYFIFFNLITATNRKSNILCEDNMKTPMLINDFNNNHNHDKIKENWQDFEKNSKIKKNKFNIINCNIM